MLQLLCAWSYAEYMQMLVESPGMTDLFEWIIDHADELDEWDEESIENIKQALEWFYDDTD
jgi:hypothetical protein